MSTDTPAAASKARKKSHKSKPKDASSKKRQRDELASPAPTSTLSPSKKRRKGDTASASATESSSRPVSKPVKSKTANSESPFVEQTISFYLPLSPIANDFAIRGLCAEHISPLLLTYYPPLSGFLLSYTNPRLSDRPSDTSISGPKAAGTASDTDAVPAPVMCRANDEYGITLVWLTVDATILRATPGTSVEGHIRLQNENYIGLVCWNFFNAVVQRRRLPADWTWVPGAGGAGDTEEKRGGKVEVEVDVDGDHGSESSSVVSSDSDSGEEIPTSAQRQKQRQHRPQSSSPPVMSQDETMHLGHFVDGKGKPIRGLVRFKIKNYECAPSSERERGFISLEGSLLDDEADRAEDDKVRAEFRAANRSRRPGRIT